MLYGGAGLLLGWESGGVQAVAAIMALAFCYLPEMLARASLAALNAGRTRPAAILARARAILQWDREILHEARILLLWHRIAAGSAGPSDAEALAEEPAGALALRWVQVAGLVRMNRFGEAVRFFEDELGWEAAGDALAAVHLVRAYAELGRMAEAFRALRALEPWRAVNEARARILDRLAFLPPLLRRETGPAWALPPADVALLDLWFHPPPAGEPKLSTLVAFGADMPSLVAEGEWWRLAAAVFLHAGILHLALNAYALWILGEMVEGFFGRRGFWILFLLSGVAGTAASAFVARTPLAVGASGGVFGLLGSSLGFLLVRRGIFPAAQRRGLIRHMLLLTAANLLLGFSIPQVDNTAHLGGLVTGLVLGIVLHPVALPDCPAWQRRLQSLLAALGGAGVLAAGILAALNASGGGYPWKPGRMTEVRMEGFTISRPAWWRDWGNGMGIAFGYQGAMSPLDGALDALPKELESARKEAPRKSWIGGRIFRVIPYEAEVKGEKVGGNLYLLERGGRVHRWDLEALGGWEEGGGDALARRILSTLEFPDERPERILAP